MDAKTKAQLDKGARVSEILKQGWDEPLAVEKQVVLIWAVTEGYAASVELKEMAKWKNSLLAHLDTNSGQKLCSLLKKEGTLTDEVLKLMKKAAETINL